MGSPPTGTCLAGATNQIQMIPWLCTGTPPKGVASTPLLPQYEQKPLYGVFRKNHLVAFLQLLKKGALFFPGTTDRVPVPHGSDWEELHDVLQNGIVMDIFRWSDVKENMVAFEALMASDNFDAAFSLAEDEFSILSRFSACARTIQVGAGQCVRDQVISKVAPLTGNAWTREDLHRLWTFAASTEPQRLQYMKLRMGYMHSSRELRISTRFFEKVGSLPGRAQALRLFLVVGQITADPASQAQDLWVREAV